MIFIFFHLFHSYIISFQILQIALLNIVAIPSIDESMGFLATLFIESGEKKQDIITPVPAPIKNQ